MPLTELECGAQSELIVCGRWVRELFVLLLRRLLGNEVLVMTRPHSLAGRDYFARKRDDDGELQEHY